MHRILILLGLVGTTAWAQLSPPGCYSPVPTNPWVGPTTVVGAYPCNTMDPVGLEVEVRAAAASWATPLYSRDGGSRELRPFDQAGLVAGAQYCLRARYLEPSQVGPWGPTNDQSCNASAAADFCFTYDDAPPSIPILNTVTVAPGTSRISAAFSPAQDDGGGVYSYQLVYESGGQGALANLPFGAAPSSPITDVLGAGTLQLRVFAVDRAGNVSPTASNAISVTTGFDASVPVPSAPTWTAGAISQGIYNNVDWAITDAGVANPTWVMTEDYGDGGFYVCQRPHVQSPGALLFTPECVSNRARIALVAGDQVSDWSAPTPPLYVDSHAPSSPLTLVVSASDGGAELSWGASTDNCAAPLSYSVERSIDDGGWTARGLTQSTSLFDSIDQSGSYVFRVTAVDLAQNRSSPTSSTPLVVFSDGGAFDAGALDASVNDAGVADSGSADAAIADAGAAPGDLAVGCGCASASNGAVTLLAFALATLLLRRRRVTSSARSGTSRSGT